MLYRIETSVCRRFIQSCWFCWPHYFASQMTSLWCSRAFIKVAWQYCYSSSTICLCLVNIWRPPGLHTRPLIVPFVHKWLVHKGQCPDLYFLLMIQIWFWPTKNIELNIQIGGNCTIQVSTTKLLEVWIDEKLSWTERIKPTLLSSSENLVVSYLRVSFYTVS